MKPAVRDLLPAGLGPFSRRELLSVLSSNGVAGAVRRGDLVRVLPDQYALAEHAESTAVRALAASRAAPAGSALTGRVALHLWRVVRAAPQRIGLVVPRGCHRAIAPWIDVTSQTLPFQRFDAGDGLVLASPELALIHAFSQEPSASRSELVYRACASGGVATERALDLIRRLPRVRGRGGLVRLLTLAGRGVESFLEERTATRALIGPAFADLVLQHRVRVDGELFRLDAYDPATRTAFESDGDESHSSPDAQRRDRRRDALLASVGIQTVRFSYTDVMARPAWCRAIARRVLAERGARES